MYAPKLVSVLILTILPVSNMLAQRGHEFQFQVGTYWNRQDSFYDFFESGGNIRHTYEIEQTYSARFQTFSWRYPINGYLEVGLFFSKSTDGTLKLFEQESAVLNSTSGNALRPDTLFVGLIEFDSDYIEAGVDLRFNFLRINKLKSYVIFSVGSVTFENIDEADNIIQAENPDLRQDLLKTYIVKENKLTAGLGVGLSYTFNNGINLKIIEFYGKNVFGTVTNLAASNSIEFRIGASYQFLRRK